MSGPRVVHIATIDQSLRYLLLDQLRSLQQAGYTVSGISTPGVDVRAIEAAGVRHIPVTMARSFTPLADLRVLWQLYRIMRREQFTIVHTHNPKPGLLGQLAARIAGVPVVVNTLHGFYFHDHMPAAMRRFYILVEKIAARCSDVILSQNREDMDVAIREGICAPEKIKYLGNGIDLTLFDPERVGRTGPPWRAALGIPAEAHVVGFVGRLAATRKGFLDFLRAGAELYRHMPDVYFLIAGETDHGKPDAVEPEVAREYGIWERCRFVGQRPNVELPELYAQMDLLVLPSLFEGVPRVIMEAAAMGVPVVATDVKGNRETVAAGRTGLLVPLGDVTALAQAMHELLSNPEQAHRMGLAGRQLALERFDQRKVFETVEAEYARLLKKKRTRRTKDDSSRPKGHPAHRRTKRASLRPPFILHPSSSVVIARLAGSPYRQYGKRILDLLVAVPALIVLSPVLAVIALLVRFKLGTPVLFRQRRPGRRGHPFTLFKFRTMTTECDASGALLPDADRLTKFGRFLRSTSLDELPELANVVRGEMSLVGPRPLLMHYLERYDAEQMRRHETLPGLTGWAQINGRNDLSWEERFALDVWYVDHQSLWLDLKILLLTAGKVLSRSGISQEGQATMSEFAPMRNGECGMGNAE